MTRSRSSGCTRLSQKPGVPSHRSGSKPVIASTCGETNVTCGPCAAGPQLVGREGQPLDEPPVALLRVDGLLDRVVLGRDVGQRAEELHDATVGDDRGRRPRGSRTPIRRAGSCAG
jgi:hypothetical protein